LGEQEYIAIAATAANINLVIVECFKNDNLLQAQGFTDALATVLIDKNVLGKY